MAWRLQRPLITVACHDDLTASDLVGRYLITGGETVWVDGPLARAVRVGAICYLDEIVEARKDTTVVIHPLADDRRVLPVEKPGELLHATPEFCLTISYNPGVITSYSIHYTKLYDLWAPDRYLGDYVRKVTGADMVLWQGACVVHEEFKADLLRVLRRQHPDAAVLVHPESPAGVIEQADVVGSTTGIIDAARQLSARKFIVATDSGILHKLRQAAPEKIFLEAPTAGAGATFV